MLLTFDIPTISCFKCAKQKAQNHVVQETTDVKRHVTYLHHDSSEWHPWRARFPSSPLAGVAVLEVDLGEPALLFTTGVAFDDLTTGVDGFDLDEDDLRRAGSSARSAQYLPVSPVSLTPVGMSM